MPYELLADTTAVLHLGFVAFAVLGAVLVLRWRWVIWLHLPAAAWAALVELGGWTCPLTPLEAGLRERAGSEVPTGDFVERYLMPLLYPEELTRGTQILLGIFVICINVLLYWAGHRLYKRRRSPD